MPVRRRGRTVLVALALAALVAVAVFVGVRLLSGTGDPAPPSTVAAGAADGFEGSDGGEPADDAPALSGRVLERTTRRPVPSATVTAVCEALGASTPRRARADEEGRFAFDTLPAGNCALRAAADGYVAGGPTSAAPTEVVVSADRALGGVTLALDQAALVSGVVVAGDAPVEDATLSVLYIEAPGEDEAFSLSPDIATDAAGRFTLPDLGPGRLQILAEKEDFALAESEEIFLRPGQNLTNVVIRLAGGGTILGVVIDPSGRAIPDARVRLAATRSRGVRRASADARGGFQFEGVPPGNATLMVSALGYQDARRADVRVVAGETTEVTLVVEPQAGFGGIVLTPERKPVGGAAVFVLPLGSALPPGHVPLRPDAYSSEDGRFWVARVPAGPTVVYATHASWGPSPRVPVPLASAEIELVLTAGGQLVGSVVDSRGAPVARFTAALQSFRPPDGGRPRAGGLPRVDVNDASGGFVFSGLAPGVYDVRIAAPGYPPVVSRNHEVAAGGETDTGPITVSRGGAVVGLVIDAETGEPVAGASLRPAAGSVMGFGGGGPRAVTDEAGEFRLDGLPPERLSLRVQATGYLTKLASGVEVPEDGEAHAGTISLTPAGEGGGRGQMQYSGIGAVLSMAGDRIVIRQTFDGSPSAGSGLEGGTEILRINGYEAGDLDLRQAVEMIRGESGSEVTLEVLRPGESYPETVRVERGDVTTPRHGGMPRPGMPNPHRPRER